MDLNPVATGGMITRLALLVAAIALSLFLYRLLRPKRGLLAHLRLRSDPGLLLRPRLLWFPVLVAFPLLIVAAAVSGYVYSAIVLSKAYLATLALIVALVLIDALIWRWLMVTRRRVAYQAQRERRQAAVAARQAAKSDVADHEGAAALGEYTDVDLDAVTEDSRALLKIAAAFAALAGLYLIWSAVLPALGLLNEVTLWYRTAMVDGEEQTLAVSLADLGLALVYLIAMAVLATRLPAVLDVVLLERFQMTSGSRYTATTVTTYAIVTLGSLLALKTIGAQWSQVQWLVAALGVGIGCGLQEIVANFITGRLLDWSLSDQVVRVMVVVGVAYGSDVEKAHALMREAAEEHERVLDDPKPVLSSEGFGDNSLTLILRAFIDNLDYRIATITDLHKAINRKFEQAGIVIAFPQRDLHLDASEPLRVTMENSKQSKHDDAKSAETGAPS